MEKLINSIKLISFNYMYSSNKTLNRFGIEYSYIATAMGNMLKSTNNEIKNVNIDKTVSILIDWSYICDLSVLLEIVSVIGLIGSAAALVAATGGLALPIFFLVVSVIGVIGGWTAMGYSCHWPLGNPWFN
jgi:hypothetical protein